MAKIIVLVSVLSWSTTRVISAGIIPESVIPSSPPLEMLKATPNSTSIKRHLRNDVAMEETSHRTEERIALLDIAAVLEQNLPQIMSKALVIWLRQNSNTAPGELFTHLKPNEYTDVNELLKDQAFFQWVFIVDSSYPSYEDASRVIFETLSSEYKDNDALFKVLLARLNIADGSAAIKFAGRMLLQQIKSWGGETSEAVFALLSLDKVKGELLDSPAFPLWVAFVKLSYPDNDSAFGVNSAKEPAIGVNRAKKPTYGVKLCDQVMFRTLSLHYKDDDALFDILFARYERPETKHDIHLVWWLLATQMESWGVTRKKSAEDVFARLNLNVADSMLIDSPGFRLWVLFVLSNHDSRDDSSWKIFNTLSRHYIGGKDALITDLIARVGSDDYFVDRFAVDQLRVQIKSWNTNWEVEETLERLNLYNRQTDELARLAYEVRLLFVLKQILDSESKKLAEEEMLSQSITDYDKVDAEVKCPSDHLQEITAKPSD